MNGVAEGTVAAALGDIEILRLHVQYESASWVILSEVKPYFLLSLVNSCKNCY